MRILIMLQPQDFSCGCFARMVAFHGAGKQNEGLVIWYKMGFLFPECSALEFQCFRNEIVNDSLFSGR